MPACWTAPIRSSPGRSSWFGITAHPSEPEDAAPDRVTLVADRVPAPGPRAGPASPTTSSPRPGSTSPLGDLPDWMPPASWSAASTWRCGHHRVPAAWRAGGTRLTAGHLIGPQVPAGALIQQPRVVCRPRGPGEQIRGRRRDWRGLPGRAGDPDHVQARLAISLRPDRGVSGDHLAVARIALTRLKPSGTHPAVPGGAGNEISFPVTTSRTCRALHVS